jgi:F-type H+-transporting ATPase subunit b
MHFNGVTLALQAANFLILMWLLGRFVFTPLRARLQERREKWATIQASVEAAEARATALKLALDQANDSIAKLKASAFADARAAIADERLAVLAAAEGEAKALRARASLASAEAERQRREDMTNTAIDQALDVARTLLLELPHEALDQAYRMQLSAWLSTQSALLDPVTLHVSADADIEAWQKIYPSALMARDDKLLAGAIFECGGKRVGFNIRDRFDAVREALRHD